MDVLKILFTSLTSIFILFILTKLMGHREMAQLTMFDYINSITIGSIAAEMATSIQDNFLEPLLAMVIYSFIILLISFFSNKSMAFRRLISGKSLILLDHNVLYKENFKKAKLDISEFLMQCRSSGYFNLADLETVILEPNGTLSFLPVTLKRPATPEDLSLTPPEDRPVANVIIDGRILENNLKATGNNETWLKNELEKQRIDRIEDVFFATCDTNNHLSAYLKNNKESSHNIFD